MTLFGLFDISSRTLPLVLPLLGSSILTLLICAQVYRGGGRLASSGFYVLVIGVAGWCCVYALEILSISLETKLLFSQIQYLFIGLVAPGWLFSTLLLTQRRMYSSFWMFLGCVPALVIFLLSVSNSYHQFVWNSAVLRSFEGTSWLVFDRAIGFWVFASIMYVQLGAGSALIAYSTTTISDLSMLNRLGLAFAAVFPLGLNVAFLDGRIGPVDLTPYALLVSIFIFWRILESRSLINIRALTQMKLLEATPVGIIAVDQRGCIVHTNPQLDAMLPGANKSVGMLAQALLPGIDINATGMLGVQALTINGNDFRVTVDTLSAPTPDLTRFITLESTTLENRQIQALEKSKVELSELSHNLRLGVFEIDTKGFISKANDTLLMISGYQRVELIGKHTGEFVAEEEVDRAVLHYKQEDNPELRTDNYTLVTKSGRIAAVIAQSSPLMEGALLKGYRIYVLDVSKELQTKTELVELSSLNDQLVNLAPFGVCCIERGSITLANSQAHQILGQSENEVLIGLPAAKVLPEELLNAVVGLTDTYSAEIRVTNTAGRNLFLQFHATPLPGTGERTLVVLDDVTLQREQTAELIESRHRYRSLMESSRDILLLTDAEDNVLDVNPSAVEKVGFSRDELLKLELSDLIFIEDQSEFFSSLDWLKNSQAESLDSIVRVMNRQGETLVFDIESIAFQTDTDSVYYQHLGRDITEQNSLQDKLQEALVDAQAASEAKSGFLASMSHEIRTPMNGILGMAQLIKSEPLQPVQSDRVDSIIRSSEVLLAILSDILDLASLDSQDLKLNKGSFSPLDIRDDMQAIFDLVAEDEQLELSIIMGDHLPEKVIGDKNRVSQVVYNLISNALKFTEKGGIEFRVEESLRTKGQSNIRFTVSDTGIGMSREQLDQVFAMFNKADLTLTRNNNGAGLGLAVTSHLVDLMDGKLTVESKLGKGSSFHVTIAFPIDDLDWDAPDARKSYADKHLLIVEDNLVNVEVITGMLSHFGCKTTVAENGREALDMFPSGDFDLVLMDVQMPVMDGLQATREIRKLAGSRAKNTPIIATTAGVMREETDACIDAGMDDFVSKPIYLDRLREVLDKYL